MLFYFLEIFCSSNPPLGHSSAVKGARGSLLGGQRGGKKSEKAANESYRQLFEPFLHHVAEVSVLIPSVSFLFYIIFFVLSPKSGPLIRSSWWSGCSGTRRRHGTVCDGIRGVKPGPPGG